MKTIEDFCEFLKSCGVDASLVERFTDTIISKGGAYFGSSPFAIRDGLEDKTPSFHISNDFQLYYDFSAHAGVDGRKGGNLSQLVVRLGGEVARGDFLGDEPLLQNYARVIGAKYRNVNFIKTMLASMKPLWDINFIMRSPVIGYSEHLGALLFLTTKQELDNDGSLRFTLTTRAHAYGLAEKGTPSYDNRTKDWIDISAKGKEVPGQSSLMFVTGARLKYDGRNSVVLDDVPQKLVLTEGEPDAVTLSHLEEDALVCTYMYYGVPAFPNTVGELYYDNGAQDNVETYVEKALQKVSEVTVFDFPDDFVMPRNYDITDWLEDNNCDLEAFKQKARNFRGGVDHFHRITFIPAGNGAEERVVRDAFLERIIAAAEKRPLTANSNRNMTGSSESIIITTAYTVTGWFSGRATTDESVLTFNIPCSEYVTDEDTNSPCGRCRVNFTRKMLAQHEHAAGSSQWTSEYPSALVLKTLPGGTLHNMNKGHSTSAELRGTYRSLGMGCKYQTKPSEDKMPAFYLRTEFGERVLCVIPFRHLEEQVVSRKPFASMTVHGYFMNEKTFVVVAMKEGDLRWQRSVLSSLVSSEEDRPLTRDPSPMIHESPDVVFTRIMATLDDIEAESGRIGYTDRRMALLMLTTMLSGCYIENTEGGNHWYLGISLACFGARSGGKSHVAKHVGGLFFSPVSSISIDNVKTTTIRPGARSTGTNASSDMMIHSGKFMVFEGWQVGTRKNPYLSYAELDDALSSGYTTASGVMARQTLGTAQHQVACPLIFVGNTPSNLDIRASGLSAFETFGKFLDATSQSALQKRVGLALAPNPKPAGSYETITLPHETLAHIQHVTAEIASYKNRRNAQGNAEHLKVVIAKLYKNNSDLHALMERRILAVANLLRVFRLSDRVTESDVEFVFELFRSGVFRYDDDLSPEINDSVYAGYFEALRTRFGDRQLKPSLEDSTESVPKFWFEFDIEVSPLAERLENLSPKKAYSIMHSAIEFDGKRGGRIYLQILAEELGIDCNYESMRKLFNIDVDDSTFRRLCQSDLILLRPGPDAGLINRIQNYMAYLERRTQQ